MDGNQSTPVPVPAAPVPAAQLAWPRSAQLALAFLLGLATALLAVHTYGYLRFGTRPTELERGAEPAYWIDLNHAGHAELLQLPGVGEKRAQRIEEQRAEQGSFGSVQGLMAVKGIGPATVNRLRPWVQVNQEAGSDALAGANNEPRLEKPAASSTKPASTRKTTGQKEAALKERIDINRATAAELQRLPGVGPKMAQRIIDERKKALFKKVEELRRVSGIGPKTLERLGPYVTVEGESERVATVDHS
jgi:competence protein ComEA